MGRLQSMQSCAGVKAIGRAFEDIGTPMHGPVPIAATDHPQRYRRDIDGLRALAILPVLLFHAHVPGFSGGYVGVDIFFVISGYLITGILARDIDCGQFSLIRFYERRFRRIIPALALMIVVTLAVSAWLYFPGDLEGVPRSGPRSPQRCSPPIYGSSPTPAISPAVRTLSRCSTPGRLPWRNNIISASRCC